MFDKLRKEFFVGELIWNFADFMTKQREILLLLIATLGPGQTWNFTEPMKFMISSAFDSTEFVRLDLDRPTRRRIEHTC